MTQNGFQYARTAECVSIQPLQSRSVFVMDDDLAIGGSDNDSVLAVVVSNLVTVARDLDVSRIAGWNAHLNVDTIFAAGILAAWIRNLNDRRYGTRRNISLTPVPDILVNLGCRPGNRIT